MLVIDGSEGEGGGQMLRSALALSLTTGLPFRMEKIRAGRDKPGLRPQHVEAARACQRIGSAVLEGAVEGSRSLHFEPGPVTGGVFDFRIRTAGSTALLLHAVYLPLLRCAESSHLRIEGGTHGTLAPCFEYLTHCWQPMIRQLGIEITLQRERCGFYPAGGGAITVGIQPRPLAPTFDCPPRGELQAIEPVIMNCRLPEDLTTRFEQRLRQRLKDQRLLTVTGPTRIEQPPSAGPGCMVGVRCRFTQAEVFFYRVGERGKRAELLVDETINDLRDFLDDPAAAVDPRLADQILLPLALLAGPARFRTSEVTQHLVTNAAIIERFVPTSITITGKIGRPGEVTIQSNPG